MRRRSWPKKADAIVQLALKKKSMSSAFSHSATLSSVVLNGPGSAVQALLLSRWSLPGPLAHDPGLIYLSATLTTLSSPFFFPSLLFSLICLVASL